MVLDKPGCAEKTEGRTVLSETNIVVCLHGVWMPRGVMLLVKRRLHHEHRFQPRLFGYRSMRATLDENAHSLAAYIEEMDPDRVHLVGHSLGGVVAMRALALYPDLPVERVVCLGSPLCGSRPATRLNRSKWGRRLIGKSVRAGVVEEPASGWAPQVCVSHEVGVIAGTVPAGLGRLATSFDGGSDGTVAVAETRLPGLKDHLCMAVSHTGLALSKAVADQVAAFLRRGEFLRETVSPASPCQPVP
jgi:pimeloyl-ACP methyl ester carboxylesterase